MKKILLMFVFFACTQLSYGQWIHFLLRNTDSQTRNEMVKTIGAASARTASVGLANTNLKNSVKHLKSFYYRSYDMSQYDTKTTDYLKNVVAGVAYQTAADFLSDKDYKTLYITKNKQNYIENIGDDRVGVIAAVFAAQLARNNVKTDNRQEMYRLSDELLRTFAKNNRDLRKVLGPTIMGEMVRSTLTDDSVLSSKGMNFFDWSIDGDIFDVGKDDYSDEEQQYLDNRRNTNNNQ